MGASRVHVGRIVLQLDANVRELKTALDQVKAQVRGVKADTSKTASAMDNATRMMQGGWKKLGATIVASQLATQALTRGISMLTNSVRSFFQESYRSLQTFEQSQISIRALLASNVKFSDDMTENYKLAGDAAGQVVKQLIALDRVTVGSLDELLVGYQQAVAQGILPMVKNLKEAAEFSSFMVNASRLYSKQSNATLGLLTNIKAVLSGESFAMAEVARMAFGTREELEKQLKVWKENKSALDGIKKALPGVSSAAADLGASSVGLETTWQTIKMMFMVDVWTPVFERLKKKAVELRDWIDNNSVAVRRFAQSWGVAGSSALDALENIGSALEKGFIGSFIKEYFESLPWIVVAAIKIVDKSLVYILHKINRATPVIEAGIKALWEAATGNSIRALRSAQLEFAALWETWKNDDKGSDISSIIEDTRKEIAGAMAEIRVGATGAANSTNWLNNEINSLRNNSKNLEDDFSKKFKHWIEIYKRKSEGPLIGLIQSEDVWRWRNDIKKEVKKLTDDIEKSSKELTKELMGVWQNYDDFVNMLLVGDANKKKLGEGLDEGLITGGDLVRKLEKDKENWKKHWEAIKESGLDLGKVWKNQMSTIMSDMSRQIADSIMEFRNWKDTLIGIIRSFAKAAIRLLIETFFYKLEQLLKNQEMSWKSFGGGLSGIFKGISKFLGFGLSFIPGVGSLLGGLFGGVTSAVGGGGGQAPGFVQPMSAGLTAGPLIDPTITLPTVGGVVSIATATPTDYSKPRQSSSANPVALQLAELTSLIASWQPSSGDYLVMQSTRSPRVRQRIGQSVFSEPVAGF